MTTRTKRLGFSLLELLAVVTILGIIAVVVIPRISVSSLAAKKAANAQNKAEIHAAVERYYFNTGTWPTPLLPELDAPEYFPGGLPKSPYDGVTPYIISDATRRVKNVPDP
jgi:prepilin-type N-terminal cleavage/methylation domain-containing protein